MVRQLQKKKKRHIEDVTPKFPSPRNCNSVIGLYEYFDNITKYNFVIKFIVLKYNYYFHRFRGTPLPINTHMHNVNNYYDISTISIIGIIIVHLHGRIELHHVGEIRHVFPDNE